MITVGGALTVYSMGKTQQTLLGSRCWSQWWLWRLRAPQREGSIKMQHIIIATVLAILYSPIHSFLPVLAISKDQKRQRKSCESWFGDGSSEATEEDFQQVILHNGVWRLKELLKSCHQWSVGGGKLWTSWGLLSELRETHEKEEFPGLPSPPFRSSIPVCVWGSIQRWVTKKQL